MSEAANQRLFEAASAGDLAAVSAALAEGAELEAKDVVGMTALTIATRGGHLPVIRFLLDQGAQVTHDTIYVASKSVYSNLWIVKLLQLAQIKQVRPSTSPNSEADARLLEAAYAGDIPGLQEAVQAGAKVSASDGQDTAALRWAARRGQAEAGRIVAQLEQHGSQYNAPELDDD